SGCRGGCSARIGSRGSRRSWRRGSDGGAWSCSGSSRTIVASRSPRGRSSSTPWGEAKGGGRTEDGPCLRCRDADREGVTDAAVASGRGAGRVGSGIGRSAGAVARPRAVRTIFVGVEPGQVVAGSAGGRGGCTDPSVERA